MLILMENPLAARRAPLSLAVREPVRLDVSLHGAWPIMVEFGLATLLLVGLSGLQLFLAMTQAGDTPHALWAGIFGLWAVNALTFLLLARAVGRQSPKLPRSHYTWGTIFVYTIEALVLLVVPLVFPVLAVAQRQRVS
jgi:hypothetical protein